MARTPEESLLDRPLVLIFAGMALGLILDVDIPSIGAVAIVVLAALMTLALSPFGLEGLRRAIPEGILATLVSLGILSPAFLLVGLLYPPGTWGGWVLLAAAPPAVSVIPYAIVLRGATRVALAGTLVSYGAAFAYLPGISLLILASAVSLVPLVQATAFLVLVPLLVSRGVHHAHLPTRTLDRGRNLLFFVVFVLVMAAVRDIVLTDPLGTAAVLGGAGLAVAGAFGVWTAASWGTQIPGPERISYDLFASYKNQTLAAALALSLLGPVAALPAIFAGVFEAVWLVVLARVARARLTPSRR